MQESESEEITKNLFKVCCAILNIKPKQRMTNKLDEAVLRENLSLIDDRL